MKAYGEQEKGPMRKSPTVGVLEKRRFIFLCRVRRKKAAQHFSPPAAKNVARQKSRAHNQSLAAAIAQNGYFDPNVAPAQQHNSQLMPCWE